MTQPIEYVIRKPNSTVRGAVRLGSSSPKMIRRRFTPRVSAYKMKSRPVN